MSRCTTKKLPNLSLVLDHDVSWLDRIVFITHLHIPPLILFGACLSRWQIWKDFSKISRGESVASFWRGYGKNNFSELSVVARAVLGALASTAILKLNVGESNNFVYHLSGSMIPTYVETMFLNGSYDLISLIISTIAPKYAESVTPLRLRDAKKNAEVRDTDCGVHDEVSLDESDRWHV